MVLNADAFSNIVKIYQDNIDALLSVMGKPCLLVFKSTISAVNNNFYDQVRGPVDNKRPDFGGDGVNHPPIEVPNTRLIIALTHLDPSDFESYGINLKLEKSIVKIKTYATDIPDLKRCEYIIPNYSEDALTQAKYKLTRGPIPRGLQENRYSVSYWSEF